MSDQARLESTSLESFVQRGKTVPVFLVVLGAIVPTLITWVYFVLLADKDPLLQKLAFGFGKGIQILVLVIAAWFYLRESMWNDLRWTHQSRPRGINMVLLGLGTGITIGAIIFTAYYFVLLPGGWMESVASEARSKVTALGGGSQAGLLALAAFYSLLHSGFEEIYWRGFVFRSLGKSVSVNIAILLSGIGFMSHHVLVVGRYFGYLSIWTLLCSLGVAVGGFLWAWTSQRTNSLLPGWISHAFVDAAIFGVGLHLLFYSGL